MAIAHALTCPALNLPLPRLTYAHVLRQRLHHAAKMSATEAAAKTFFSYPAFAVVGASSNPAKFGNTSTCSSPDLSPSSLHLPAHSHGASTYT